MVTTTPDHLLVYFGCTAQTPIIGGAGLVSMRSASPAHDFRFRPGKVVPVTRTAAAPAESPPLFAGSMFATGRRALSVAEALRDCARENSPARVLLVVLCALWLPYHMTYFY